MLARYSKNQTCTTRAARSKKRNEGTNRKLHSRHEKPNTVGTRHNMHQTRTNNRKIRANNVVRFLNGGKPVDHQSTRQIIKDMITINQHEWIRYAHTRKTTLRTSQAHQRFTKPASTTLSTTNTRAFKKSNSDAAPIKKWIHTLTNERKTRTEKPIDHEDAVRKLKINNWRLWKQRKQTERERENVRVSVLHITCNMVKGEGELEYQRVLHPK